MAAPSAAVAHHRARIARMSQNRPPNDPTLIEARRDLAAERLREYVERTIADWPPLTDEQRTRIAALLQVGA